MSVLSCPVCGVSLQGGAASADGPVRCSNCNYAAPALSVELTETPSNSGGLHSVQKEGHTLPLAASAPSPGRAEEETLPGSNLAGAVEKTTGFGRTDSERSFSQFLAPAQGADELGRLG